MAYPDSSTSTSTQVVAATPTLDTRYLVDGGDADPAPPDDESQEVAWFDWPAAIDLADDGVRAILIHLQP